MHFSEMFHFSNGKKFTFVKILDSVKVADKIE